MKIFIGVDPREGAAYEVAANSAKEFGCEVIPLREDLLRLSGMLYRPTDTRGQWWDLNSGAPQSTAFAIARFFPPILAHHGWCLFADADVIFLRNPNELKRVQDDKFAVMVVKHGPQQLGSRKMDNQVQTDYPRKLWSSVILYNCDHPGNRRLNLQMLNQWPGRDLHAFKWLADSEIGSLEPEWNWLVGMQPKPENPAIAHFTLGTPDMAGHENDPYSEIWKQRASQR